MNNKQYSCEFAISLLNLEHHWMVVEAGQVLGLGEDVVGYKCRDCGRKAYVVTVPND
jgi:hypothetical protein